MIPLPEGTGEYMYWIEKLLSSYSQVDLVDLHRHAQYVDAGLLAPPDRCAPSAGNAYFHLRSL